MLSQTLATLDLEKYLKSPFYQIVHQTNGRIRLRIFDLQNPDYAACVERSLKACRWVTKVCLNPVAQSATVYYAAYQVSQETFQAALETALQRAVAPAIAPHTTTALAQRLGVTFQALTWHRSHVNFAEWSQDRDPDYCSWCYEPETKLFHLVAAESAIAAVPSKGEQVLLALSGAASGRVGSIVGKLAGEVLGVVLLGSAGMAIGAEVGTLVGEIVGAELASFS